MAYREIPHSTRVAALAMYGTPEEGASAVEVGRAVGVSTSAVLRWAREAGVARNQSQAARLWQGRDRGRRRKALRMIAAGMSGAEAARRLGVPERTLYDWTADAGLDLTEMRRRRGWHR